MSTRVVESRSHEPKQADFPVGGSVYKTDGVLNQPYAVQVYRDLLVWIKKPGAEPVLALTPYHENVWKSEDSPNVIAMRATEAIVADLASELHLKLVGSYDPRQAGCLSSEFYDFMHPTAECLGRLRAR